MPALRVQCSGGARAAQRTTLRVHLIGRYVGDPTVAAGRDRRGCSRIAHVPTNAPQVVEKLDSVPNPNAIPNPHQVVEKLDSVPVFTVTTLEKQLMPVPDEAGTTCCRWYADVDEAQRALVLTQHLHPDTPLVLGVTPLGTLVSSTVKVRVSSG